MKYALFLFALWFLGSCTEELILTEEVLPEGNVLRANVNGNAFLALDETVAAGITQVDSVTVIVISGGSADISRINVASEGMVMGMTIVRNEEFKASSEWYTTSEDDEINVTGAYSKLNSLSNDADVIESSSENAGGSARLRVTEWDKEAQTISGEFEFTAVSEATGDVFVVSEGRFTKAPYK